MDAGRIYLVDNDGALFPLIEEPYDSEEHLQTLLANHSALLAGEQMYDGQPRKWLLLAREATVAGTNGASPWYVDHVFVDQDGIPTLIEVKRSSDTRIRREVIGQMLDYAANVVARWSPETLRTLYLSGKKSVERLQEFLNGDDPEQFWDKLGVNLAAGRIRMVFVADVIPPELRTVVDFLAAQLKTAEVFAIEVRKYRGPANHALVPRLVSTPKTNRSELPERQWDEATFLNQLATSHAVCVGVARSIIAWARQCSLDLEYGRGAEYGSCTPRLAMSNARIALFTMWTNARIEMQFQYLNVTPFDDESNRLDLVRRLNTITGVHIPENAIRRRPGFDMSLLAGEAELHQFQELMQAAFLQIKNHSRTERGDF